MEIPSESCEAHVKRSGGGFLEHCSVRENCLGLEEREERGHFSVVIPAQM